MSSAIALGSFVQPNVTGTFKVLTCDWDDGSGQTKFNVNEPGSLGTQTHTYSAVGTYQVTEDVISPQGNQGGDFFYVTVGVPPVLTPPANQTVGQGLAASVSLGSFTDAGVPGPWNVDVNWDDGSLDTLFSVNATRGRWARSRIRYANAGYAYTVTVTVTDLELGFLDPPPSRKLSWRPRC